MPLVVTSITGARCTWAMVDHEGYEYPHGIRATKRVTGAAEFYSGDFCARHARLAVERSVTATREEAGT